MTITIKASKGYSAEARMVDILTENMTQPLATTDEVLLKYLHLLATEGRRKVRTVKIIRQELHVGFTTAKAILEACDDYFKEKPLNRAKPAKHVARNYTPLSIRKGDKPNTIRLSSKDGWFCEYYQGGIMPQLIEPHILAEFNRLADEMNWS